MNYPVHLLSQFAPELNITPKMQEQFDIYARLLEEWNQKINLTAITQPDQVVIKHFLDSIIWLKYIDILKGASVIDVGTGAGFPGIPLKIICPDIKLTLLDSLNKRLLFLDEVTKHLEIGCTLIHARAEEGGRDKKQREKYDFATARAVAHLRELSEYCLPFVKPGGKFIALKGFDIAEEIKESEKALLAMGGRVKNIFTFDLENAGGRTVVEVLKEKPTPPQYPRQPGKIKSNPII